MHLPSFTSSLAHGRSERQSPNSNSTSSTSNIAQSEGQQVFPRMPALRPHDNTTGRVCQSHSSAVVDPQTHHRPTTTSTTLNFARSSSLAASSSSSLHHSSSSYAAADLGNVLERVSELTFRVNDDSGFETNDPPDLAAFSPNNNNTSVKRQYPSTPTSLQKRFSWSSLEQYQKNLVLKRSRRGSSGSSNNSTNDLAVVAAAERSGNVPHLPSSPDLDQENWTTTTRTMMMIPPWRQQRHPAPLISPSIVRFHFLPPALQPPPPQHVRISSSEPPLQLDEHITTTATTMTTVPNPLVHSTVSSSSSSGTVPPPPPPPMPLMSTPDLVPRRIAAPNLLKMRSSAAAAFLPML